MIRLTFYLRRKAGFSQQEFQAYWRDQHGPLVAGFSTDLNIMRYVQVHTIDDPINAAMNKARGGEMEPPYDGVAELWWENEASLTSALESERGAAAGSGLLADEQKFIDLPSSPLYMAHEYPQVNPTPEDVMAHPKNSVLKVYFPLRHIESMDEQEVRRYWLTNHGPIIRSHAPASAILRYIQVHRADHPMDQALRESRGTLVEPYLGHAEVWFDRSRTGTPESGAANRAAIEDESRFIDFKRSSIWVGKEYSLIDRR
jgi:uncharacterized protein (TIGR02118 family)